MWRRSLPSLFKIQSISAFQGTPSSAIANSKRSCSEWLDPPGFFSRPSPFSAFSIWESAFQLIRITHFSSRNWIGSLSFRARNSMWTSRTILVISLSMRILGERCSTGFLRLRRTLPLNLLFYGLMEVLYLNYLLLDSVFNLFGLFSCWIHRMIE